LLAATASAVDADAEIRNLAKSISVFPVICNLAHSYALGRSSVLSASGTIGLIELVTVSAQRSLLR